MDFSQLFAQLTGAANARLDQINTTGQQVGTLNQQAAAQDDARVAGLRDATQLAADAAAKQAAVDLQINLAKQKNIALAGLDPEEVNNAYVRATAEFDVAERERKATEAARVQQLRRYEQLASANLLTDPLGYISAQLQMPQIAAQHNSLLAQEAEATNRRDQANVALQARVAMVRERNSISVANTAAAANEAAVQLAAAKRREADAQLAAATADNFSRQAVRLLESSRLQGEAYAVHSGIIDKSIAIEQWRENRAAQQLQAKAITEERTRRNELAKKEQASKDEYFKSMRVVGAVLGHADITEEVFNRLPKQKQQLLNDAVSRMRIGDNLYEGLVTVEAVGYKPGIAASNPGLHKFIEFTGQGLQGYVADVKADQAKAALQPGFKAMKTEEIYAEAGRRMQEDLEVSAHSLLAPRALNHELYDTRFNPYKPAFLDLAKSPALQKNTFVPLISKLAEPLGTGAANLPGKSVNQLFDAAAQQIANGQLDPDTAARDWVALHQYSANLNKHLYQYSEFGMKDQSSAIYKIPPPSSWYGSEIKLDGMDLASTKKAFAQRAIEFKRGGLNMQFAPNPRLFIGTAGVLPLAGTAVGVTAGTSMISK